MSSLCFICDQSVWQLSYMELFSSLSDEDDLLSPLHTFYLGITKFKTECEKCAKKPIIGLIGYSGAGKSTILNILARNFPYVYLDDMGNLSLAVLDSIKGSEISNSASSMTLLPNYHHDQNFVFCDFPGFGDTRGGHIQLLQFLITKFICEARLHKFVVIKSALTKRDQG